MILHGSVFSICRDAAGVAGHIFAFGLFLSPLDTFRRVIRNQTTEQFSGLPYIYALLNCLICLWYGTPLISPRNTMVVTINSIGAVFQLVYIFLFITYAEKGRKMKMIGLLLAVFAIFIAIVAGSLQIANVPLRRNVVGILSCASLVSMFASPLFII
ncbi:bidirectional sugar transporter SWEET2-like, partial [Cucurbita pepo subsp. pepo]|uniref:bidirectional sugar transporter SWEET2-like n=1 Tax=Cucurbita pepo subsp. pepo TaxID=3664 RepID=UPI000C9D7BBD